MSDFTLFVEDFQEGERETRTLSSYKNEIATDFLISKEHPTVRFQACQIIENNLKGNSKFNAKIQSKIIFF